MCIANRTTQTRRSFDNPRWLFWRSAPRTDRQECGRIDRTHENHGCHVCAAHWPPQSTIMIDVQVPSLIMIFLPQTLSYFPTSFACTCYIVFLSQSHTLSSLVANLILEDSQVPLVVLKQFVFIARFPLSLPQHSKMSHDDKRLLNYVYHITEVFACLLLSFFICCTFLLFFCFPRTVFSPLDSWQLGEVLWYNFIKIEFTVQCLAFNSSKLGCYWANKCLFILGKTYHVIAFANSFICDSLIISIPMICGRMPGFCS